MSVDKERDMWYALLRKFGRYGRKEGEHMGFLVVLIVFGFWGFCFWRLKNVADSQKKSSGTVRQTGERKRLAEVSSAEDVATGLKSFVKRISDNVYMRKEQDVINPQQTISPTHVDYTKPGNNPFEK